MGCGASAQAAYVQPDGGGKTKFKAQAGFRVIPDQYKSYDEVAKALRNAGLESSQLVVAVDFTKSNTWTGEKSFGGKCLHDLNPETPNPYRQVLTSIGAVLKDFDDDNLIPAYGFGDVRTKQSRVFSFNSEDEPCDGLDGVLQRYESVTADVKLSGPTSFAPVIRQTVDLVRATNEYHILLIIADGQVDQVEDTVNAIVEASEYPLSIVTVGVGDGPWDLMNTFDDELPQRKFDNFQFVEFSKIQMQFAGPSFDSVFAMHALMEVPEQYQFVKLNGLLRGQQRWPSFIRPEAPLGPPGSTSSPPGRSSHRSSGEVRLERPQRPSAEIPSSPSQPYLQKSFSLRRSGSLKSFAYGCPEGLKPASDTARELVQELMDATWKGKTTRDRGYEQVQRFEVVQVLENGSDEIWSLYCKRRDDIAKLGVKMLGDVKTVIPTWEDGLQDKRVTAANEFFLFHGTRPAAAQMICKNHFRVDLAGSNKGALYGPGIYFAESSAKADEYASDDQDGLYRGLFAMLLCRVALGNSVVTDEVTPDVASLNGHLEAGGYHSILGDREKSRGTFREFIVRDAHQAYPAYVIIYRRKADVLE